MATIITAVAVVVLFVFNGLFLALVDDAFDHPAYQYLGWLKDPAFYALLLGLTLGEVSAGWFIAESGLFVGVPWQWEPYLVLGIAVSMSVLLFFSGYYAWKKEKNEQEQQKVVFIPEDVFWNKDLGLYIIESVRQMPDSAVLKLYKDSYNQMDALSSVGRNIEWQIHINSIAFVEALDRGLNPQI